MDPDKRAGPETPHGVRTPLPAAARLNELLARLIAQRISRDRAQAAAVGDSSARTVGPPQSDPTTHVE